MVLNDKVLPLQVAPHASHVKMALFAPVELSRRLPQSLQKTREPIADILCSLCPCGIVGFLVGLIVVFELDNLHEKNVLVINNTEAARVTLCCHKLLHKAVGAVPYTSLQGSGHKA